MKYYGGDEVVAVAILAGGLLAWTLLFGLAWECCQ
jgi:hypothetical protein